MFLLRTIDTINDQVNEELGDLYTLHTHLDECFESIKRQYQEKYCNSVDKAFAFIICLGGSSIKRLDKGKKYYIMTESGKTFDCLYFNGT